jgi:S-adenosylmethionine decarboxylase proenzyme
LIGVKRVLGLHYLAEFFECDPDRIAVSEHLQALAEEAARRGGATVVGRAGHQFHPHGASGVVLLAESHLAFHTWPEEGYVALDLFTCSEELDVETIFNALRRATRAKRVSTRCIERGFRPGSM